MKGFFYCEHNNMFINLNNVIGIFCGKEIDQLIVINQDDARTITLVDHDHRIMFFKNLHQHIKRLELKK